MFGRLFQPEAIFDSKCIKAFGDRAPPDSPAGLKGSLREGRDKTGNESSSDQQFLGPPLDISYTIALMLLRPREGCEILRSACLFVCSHISKTACTRFSYMLSVFSNFTGRQCNMLSRLHSVSRITSGLPIIGKAKAFSF